MTGTSHVLELLMNSSHDHKTKLWYLLGVPFKISDDHPRQFFLSFSQDHGVTYYLQNVVLFVWFPWYRKRGKAKVCAALAWHTICDYSEIAVGIYNKVIGDFNPFCSNDKDPWASKPDLCANYTIPRHDLKCTYFFAN